MRTTLPEELKAFIKNVQNSAKPGDQRAAVVKLLRRTYKALQKMEPAERTDYLSNQAQVIEVLMKHETERASPQATNSEPEPDAD